MKESRAKGQIEGSGLGEWRRREKSVAVVSESPPMLDGIIERG
jgi:hypothetical protein